MTNSIKDSSTLGAKNQITIKGNVYGGTIHAGDIYNQIVSSSIEIPYSVLNIEQGETESVIEKIGIQLNIIKIGHDHGPFVPPKGFLDWSSEDHNKLLLYGPSGCGKSRAIFELISQKIRNYENIYIINPRTLKNKASAIDKLVTVVGENDAVIWDNFPDLHEGQRDIESGIRALELLSSASIKNLFVTLQPLLLEHFRSVIKDLPYLYTEEISFDEESIEIMLNSYGKNISRFNEVYKHYVEDYVRDISNELSKRERTPLVMQCYYNLLLEKDLNQKRGYINAVEIAKEFELPSKYYKNQFKQISRERPRHAHMLYTLRLCNDIGIESTYKVLNKLQRDIFNSEPIEEPSLELSTWIYLLSNKYYALPDTAANAIEYGRDIILKVVDYLQTDEFLKFIKAIGDASFKFGLFVGKNIEYVEGNSSNRLLPQGIFNFMKDEIKFTQGLALGIAKHFSDIKSKDLQFKILRFTKEETGFLPAHQLGSGGVLEPPRSIPLFAEYLAEGGIAKNFALLHDKDLQLRILELAEEGEMWGFANFVHFDLGYAFGMISDTELQQKILELTSSYYSEYIGYGIGENIELIKEKKIQEMIFDKMSANVTPRWNFAYGLGKAFPFMHDESLKRRILELAGNLQSDNVDGYSNAEYFGGVCAGLAEGFSYLESEFQMTVLKIIELDNGMGEMMGIAIGKNFVGIRDEGVRNKIWKMVEEEKQFKSRWPIPQEKAPYEEFEEGDEFAGWPIPQEKELYEEIEEGDDFAVRFAEGLGQNYSSIRDKKLRLKIWQIADKNKKYFASGLGRSLGSNFAVMSDKEIKLEILSLAEKNTEFASEFGHYVGLSFKYSAFSDTRSRLFEIISTSKDFASGFGWGLAEYLAGSYPHYLLPTSGKEMVFDILEIAKENNNLVHGLFETQSDSSYLIENLDKLDKDLQLKILELARTKIQSLPDSVYEQLVEKLPHLDKDIRLEVLSTVRDDKMFLDRVNKALDQYNLSRKESLAKIKTPGVIMLKLLRRRFWNRLKDN